MERYKQKGQEVSLEPLSEDYVEKICWSAIRIILQDIYLSSLFDAARAATIVISVSGTSCHFSRKRQHKNTSLLCAASTVRIPRYEINSKSVYFNQKYIWKC